MEITEEKNGKKKTRKKGVWRGSERKRKVAPQKKEEKEITTFISDF